jgi:hypothetical protein
MKTVPIEMQVVDMATGQVVEQRDGPFNLLPPKPGVCQVCAHDHEALLPHNLQSLYYQYAFYGAVGRWPTWADACAHCDEALTAKWRQGLADHGQKWSRPPDGYLPVRDLGPVVT